MRLIKFLITFVLAFVVVGTVTGQTKRTVRFIPENSEVPVTGDRFELTLTPAQVAQGEASGAGLLERRAVAGVSAFPLIYRPGTLVVDSSGNLLILDTVFVLPQPGVSFVLPHARITVVPFPTGGTPVAKAFEYNGTFSAVAEGNKAVYATVSTAATSAGQPPLPNLTLVALRVSSTGTLPVTLPSLPLSGFANIKVVPGAASDIIYIVPQPFFLPVPLTPGSPVSASVAPVQIVRFDGTSFTPIATVSLP